MKNSKLLKSCLALSMVFGTNGYLMTNISAEGEEEEASDLTSTTLNSSEAQNIGGDQTPSQTTTDYSSLITDSLTYNEDKTATITISINTENDVYLDIENADDFQILYDSGKMSVNEAQTSDKQLSFNVAENGDYSFVVGVYSADGTKLSSTPLTISVSGLDESSTVDTNASTQTAAAYTLSGTVTAENVEVAYFAWQTESDTSDVNFIQLTPGTSVETNNNFSVDYSNSGMGYLLFFVKPTENHLFTSLGAYGAGQAWAVGTGDSFSTADFLKDGLGIGGYPGLENVILAARKQGYVACYGYSKDASATTLNSALTSVEPKMDVELVTKGSSKGDNVTTGLEPGDKLYFKVNVTPDKLTNTSVSSVKLTKIDGESIDMDLSEDSEVSGTYTNTDTIEYTITEDDWKSGRVNFTVDASVTYDCTLGLSVGTAATTSTIAEEASITASPEPSYNQDIGIVKYQFESSDSSLTLPNSVKGLLPSDENVELGEFTPSQPTSTKVNVDGGYWKFNGWSPENATISEKDVITFTGTWEFVNTGLSITAPTGDSVTKTYDGNALNPSASANINDATITYYTKNGSNEWAEYGTTAPSITDAGSLEVKAIATKTGYESSEATYTLTVNQRPVTFTGQTATRTYTGSQIELTDVTVSENGLVNGHTSNVSYSAKGINVQADAYQGTITDKDEVVIEDASGNVVTSNYDITTTPGTLTITGQSINSKKEDGTDDLAYKGVTVTAPDNTVYNGQSQKLKPTVKDANNNPLTEGSDYELEYSKDTTNVGTVTVTIKGKGNYSGTVTTTYQITPATGLSVIAPTGDSVTKTYDGNALNPSAKASIDGITITGATITYYTKNKSGEWVEYGTTAPSITDAGSLEVKAIATKTGYESSEATYTLTVNQRPVTFTGQTATRTYTGSQIELTDVTVSENGLVNGHTSNVSYSAKGINVQADAYQGTITDKDEVVIEDASGNVVTSNYDITTTPGTLTITGQSINSKKEDGTDDLAYKGVTVTAPDNTVYNGQSQKLKPTVKDANNNPLTEGSDYELEYSKDTTNVGTVTVTIKGKGNYSGTVTTTYQITPAPIKEEDETDTPRFTISEIDSVVYNGTSQKQAPVIKDGDKELKEGQDYKLTYSEDTTNAGEITVTIEGLGNYAGKVTKTYSILQKQVTVTVKDNSKVYGSKDPELKVNVNGYVEGEADKISYLVSRDAGEDVGKYDIVANGETSQGNYLVEYVPATFTITSQSISSEDKDSYGNVEIGGLNPVVYNGTSQKQAPVIKDGDKELKEGQDYKLTYSEDTTNAGEITVTIEGLGNYAGKVSKTYTIMKVNSSANLSGISSKYNGSNQILVTDAKVEGGTIYYSLDGKTYSTTMPEKKEAGTYTIYYYVKADKNHNDLGSESKPLTVEAKITEEEKVESESKVKTSTATHTFFFESMGVAAAGLFIALRKRMNK